MNVYNIYTLRGFPGGLRKGLLSERLVRFVSHDGRYTLPDPRLLRQHAVLSKMWNNADMKGALFEFEAISNLPGLALGGREPYYDGGSV